MQAGRGKRVGKCRGIQEVKGGEQIKSLQLETRRILQLVGNIELWWLNCSLFMQQGRLHLNVTAVSFIRVFFIVETDF